MSIFRHKLFSKDKEEGSTGKKIATGAANVGLGLGLGYVALKQEKKYLEKKLKSQEEAANRGIEASDKFAKKSFEGVKNKVKNYINPRRKAVLEAREEDLWQRGAGKALSEACKTREKLNRVNNLLDVPKRVVETIKGGSGKVKGEVSKHVTKFKNKQRSAAFMKSGKAFRHIVKK